MALVEAARYFTYFEASLARARLQAAGIASFMFDMEMNCGGLEIGVVPARLMVDEEDFAAARAVLEEEPEEDLPASA